MNFSRVIIALVLLIVIFTGTILWDTAIKRPSVLREWQVETRVLPEVQLSSGQAIVKNVRNFSTMMMDPKWCNTMMQRTSLKILIRCGLLLSLSHPGMQ